MATKEVEEIEDAKDICNVCGKPFVRDENGEWINHKHRASDSHQDR